MIRQLFYTVCPLLHVSGNGALLLLVQMLPGLAQGLGENHQTVCRSIFLRLQLRGRPALRLPGDLSGDVLSLVHNAWGTFSGGFGRRTGNGEIRRLRGHAGLGAVSVPLVTKKNIQFYMFSDARRQGAFLNSCCGAGYVRICTAQFQSPGTAGAICIDRRSI
jgi:hypothetical protein